MFVPKELYPTPEKVALDMLYMIKWEKVNSILEPSAGYGDLAMHALSRFNMKNRSYYNDDKEKLSSRIIDLVEIDEKCRAFLSSKGGHVVGEDFLRFQTFRRYDLIIMNPPFSEGCKHLLKAIEMQKYGGQICCLLNAETIKNPCTLERQVLADKIEQYSATVTDFGRCFENAERSTDVEVSCVYFDIPKGAESDILKNLEKAEKIKQQEQEEETQISVEVEEYIRAIVGQYDRECKAGITLIAEYEAISSKSLTTFDEKGYPSRILELRIHGKQYPNDLINEYVELVRYKYWETLFGRPEMLRLMTQKMQEEYHSKLDELRYYEFNLANIYQIQLDLSKSNIQSVEQAIMDLFHKFTEEHSWYPECAKNIHHYYNGWATNKCGVVNKKVIIPLNAYDSWLGRYEPDVYSTSSKIADIEKVFTYLDFGSTSAQSNIYSILQLARERMQTKNVEFKYFYMTFYKKGTAHITFKDEELLKRFNIFAGQREGGLPPSYGKKAYKDMTPSEKAVIDEFEGEESYNAVYENPDNFILETSSILALQ